MKRTHLRLDLKCETLPEDKEEQQIYFNRWFEAILSSIDMKCIDGPYFTYGEASEKGAQEGWTMISTIDFSSITLHHFKADNELKIDIFSCKPFNYKLAKEVCLAFFGKKVQFEDFVVIG